MAAGSALEVRLITGETIKVQITPELSTIKLLKIFLAQDRDSLAGCQLFLNGRQLPGRTPLATLPLGPGAFLVALEGRPRPAHAAAPQQPQEQEASHVTPPDATSPRKLDTLLPGYLSRPQPSPRKRPQESSEAHVAAEPTEEVAAPDHAPARGTVPSLLDLAAARRMREDLLRDAAEAEAAAAAAPQEAAPAPHPAPKKRSTQRKTSQRIRQPTPRAIVTPPGLPSLPDGAAAATLPLPPFLRLLEAKLRRIITMHDFFQRNRLQCTWTALQGSTGGTASAEDSVTLEDLRLMEALAPRALHILPHVSASEDPTQRQDAWRKGAAAPAEATEATEPGSGDVPGLLVALVDPWQARFGDEPPPPAAFLEEMAAAEAAVAAAAPEAPQSVDEEVDQAFSDAEGDYAADERPEDSQKVSKKRRRSARPNKRRRIEWEFRKGALRALALIQARHFGDAVPPLPVEPEQQQRRQPTRPARRSRAARQAQQTVGTTIEASETTEVVDLVNDGPPADLDVLMAAGRWHPAFPLTTAATPAAVAAAAAELRDAQRAADKATDASADALAAARAAAAAGPAPPPPSKRSRPAAPPQLLKNHAPCMDTSPLTAPAFLNHLQSLPGYQNQVVHVERLPERLAALAALDPPPPAPVAAALAARGISPESLYSHQAAAIASLRAGRHTVVATATASGKSLCYAVPILEALVSDPTATALLIFPTKALAQDQLRALRDMAAAAGLGGGAAGSLVAIYDGDTPNEDRPGIRDSARIVLTNPDMLHVSVLPVHLSFSRFLSGLRVAVVDEGHAYKGAFGCHVSLVLRRLRRVCERVYGTSPVFAVTTATLANPAQHAAALLGVTPEEVEVVSRDGSPSGAKEFVLWNPPLRSPGGIGENSGGGGGGGGRWAKRAAQEAERAALRAARQERNAGVMLGTEAISEQQWEASVGSGPRDPVAKARARGSSGVSGAGTSSLRSGGEASASVQLSARQRALAAQAAAAVAAAAGPGSNPAALPALRPVDSSGAAVAPRRVISLGPSPSTASHNTAAAVPPLAPSHGDPQLPEGVAAKAGRARARLGTSGADAAAARTSPIVEIAALLAEAVQHRLRTIAFCKSRKLAELVTAYVREILAVTAPALASRVAVYRAGYSPAERREIEGALFSGALLGVAATNALELGVDVGGLDATLHLGFPGSVASLWQQAGRAGRRGQPSVSIYVGWDGPLDQFFFNNPAALFSRPVEAALVDPGNPAALEAHVACAAAEAQLDPSSDSQRYFGPGLGAAVAALQERRLLSAATLGYIGAAENPATGVTLRAIDPGRYTIIDESAPGGGRVLEEVEESKAFYQVYDGGTYFFQGRTYLVRKLDLEARLALVRPADIKYFTRPVDFTAVTVVGGGESSFPSYQPQNASASGNGEFLPTSARADAASVTTRWLGFVRVWRGTGQVFDSVDLFLPDVRYETTAAHLRLPPSARRAVEAAGLPFRDSLHAAAHAVLNALPLFLMANPQDVGTECDHPYDTRYKPERILLYDKLPGGVGLAAAAAPRFTELLVRALALVEGCSCGNEHGESEPVAGCPSCVQHLDCSEYNAVLCKRGAALVLREALEAEAQRFGLDRRRLGLESSEEGGGEGGGAEAGSGG